MPVDMLRLNLQTPQIFASNIKDSGGSFIRKNLVHIVAGLALSTIAIGTFYLYRQYQLSQPVECKFGNTPEENQKAFDFYIQGANNRYPAHQYCLGRMYLLGIGTPESLDKARDSIKQAAQQGLFDAQYMLCNSCKLFRHANITEIEYKELAHLAETCQEGAKCSYCDGPWAYSDPKYICFHECLANRTLPGCDRHAYHF